MKEDGGATAGRGGAKVGCAPRADVLVLEHAGLLDGRIEIRHECAEGSKIMIAEVCLQCVVVVQCAEHDGAVRDYTGQQLRAGVLSEAGHDPTGNKGVQEGAVSLRSSSEGHLYGKLIADYSDAYVTKIAAEGSAGDLKEDGKRHDQSSGSGRD